MKDKFLGKDFLTVMDYTKEEVLFILDVASDLKRKWAMREPHEILKERNYFLHEHVFQWHAL